MHFLTARFALKASAAITLIVVGTSTAFADLIANGNFEDGTNGWMTDYVVDSGNGGGATGAEGAGGGKVGVVTSSSDWHPSFVSFGDHDGGGHMLIVNGSADTNKAIWKEDVAVAVGHTYALSFWATSAYPSSPGVLHVTATINGLVHDFDLADTTPGTWKQFTVTWTADMAPTTIRFTDNNTEPSGNDFALDDISLVQVVPLPVSAWGGLVGLAGVGCVGAIRRRRLIKD